MIRFLSEFGGISSRLFASCPDKVSSCSPKCAGKDRFSLKPYANEEEEVLADDEEGDGANQDTPGHAGEEERFQAGHLPAQLQIPRTIILHYSPWKAAWDWLILLLVIYVAVMTPYLAAFRVHSQEAIEEVASGNSSIVVTFLSDKLILVDFLVDITFLVDMLVNFRTTYLSNGELVVKPSKIASNYLRSWFLIDAVSAIPFDLILSVVQAQDTMTATGLLKTPRLLRLLRVARRIDQYSEYGASVLLLLMASFTMIAHWLACIFYALGRWERPQLEHPIGWLDLLAAASGTKYEAEDGPDVQSRYITSLYFTFTILTSVGFGNIAPLTNYEKVFSIFAMMLGSLMSAAIFGNVASIMLRLYQGSEEYHEKTTSVKAFIKFHRVPKPLSVRLIESCQQTWWQTSGVDMTAVLKSFPEGLQADICLHLNKTLLSKCTAFQSATPGCLRALSLKLKTVHIPPGDAIFHQGDLLPAIFFVGQGTLEISRDDVVVAILGKHDIFGEDIQLATAEERVGGGGGGGGAARSGYRVRALSYCDLHRILIPDLLEILGLYSEFATDFLKRFRVTFNLRMPSDFSRDTSKLRLSKTSSQEPVKAALSAEQQPSKDIEDRRLQDGVETDTRSATSALRADDIATSVVGGEGSASPEEDTTSGDTSKVTAAAGLVWDNSDMEANGRGRGGTGSSVQSGPIVDARGCGISWADDDTLVASPQSDVQSFRVNFDYEQPFERPEPTTPTPPNDDLSHSTIESKLDDLNRRLFNFDRQLTSAVDAILELLSSPQESTENWI